MMAFRSGWIRNRRASPALHFTAASSWRVSSPPGLIGQHDVARAIVNVGPNAASPDSAMRKPVQASATMTLFSQYSVFPLAAVAHHRLNVLAEVAVCGLALHFAEFQAETLAVGQVLILDEPLLACTSTVNSSRNVLPA